MRTGRSRSRLVAGAVVVLALLAAGLGLRARLAAAPVQGRLTVAPGLRRRLTWRAGTFLVTWYGYTGSLVVTRRGRTVWASPPGRAFLAAARGTMTAREHIGYFRLQRRRTVTYADQRVTAIRARDGSVVVSGRLSDGTGAGVPYRLTLAAAGPHALAYRFQAGGADRLFLDWRSAPGEGYYGFGVQFTVFNLAGHRLPVLVEEHGYGRGAEPLTLLADLTNQGAGGTWHNTYAPVPFFLTSTGQALYSRNRGYQVFNLTRPGLGQLEVDARCARGVWLAGRSPGRLIRAYTAFSGRMAPLPAWTQQGVILAAEGGTRAVLRDLRRVQAAHVPVAAVWIQDWTGVERTSFGTQVVWNWQRDRRRYPHWHRLLAALTARHIRVLGYVNPFLQDTGRPPGPGNLYAVARARGYLVETAAGRPYPFHYPGRTAYLVDLSNPRARAWLEGVMARELAGNGFAGWMADFGEELPIGARTWAGRAGSAAHNRYPVLWARVNRAVLRRTGLAGQGLVFLRAGFATSPRYAPAFWLGDQLETWGPRNGLESSVIGLLSAGLSGFTLEHSDTGGYTSLVQFPFHIVRTPQLLERWMEVNAFTVLFRTHEGNRPGFNTQVWSSPALLARLRRMAELYRALAPYRERLMAEAAATGLPPDRPLFLNYPHDPEAWRLGAREFMLGRGVLVAPVYRPGQDRVRVYLPPGCWIHLWDGRVYAGGRGRWVTVAAPPGHPAAFVRVRSTARPLLAAAGAVPASGQSPPASPLRPPRGSDTMRPGMGSL
ncbi:MAG: alpha-glucosidase [Firmicutes bacterium]|nr:alpha-glucosidase [Bacillota bacterium]